MNTTSTMLTMQPQPMDGPLEREIEDSQVAKYLEGVGSSSAPLGVRDNLRLLLDATEAKLSVRNLLADVYAERLVYDLYAYAMQWRNWLNVGVHSNPDYIVLQTLVMKLVCVISTACTSSTTRQAKFAKACGGVLPGTLGMLWRECDKQTPAGREMELLLMTAVLKTCSNVYSSLVRVHAAGGMALAMGYVNREFDPNIVVVPASPLEALPWTIAVALIGRMFLALTRDPTHWSAQQLSGLDPSNPAHEAILAAAQMSGDDFLFFSTMAIKCHAFLQTYRQRLGEMSRVTLILLTNFFDIMIRTTAHYEPGARVHALASVCTLPAVGQPLTFYSLCIDIISLDDSKNPPYHDIQDKLRQCGRLTIKYLAQLADTEAMLDASATQPAYICRQFRHLYIQIHQWCSNPICKAPPPFHMCSACAGAAYCSESCRNAHHSEHREICAATASPPATGAASI